MQRIILASGSPRRKELLERIGIPFIVIVSGVDENSFGYTDAIKFAKDMAHNKAIDIFERYKEGFQNDYILAADTIVVKDGHILGKPENALHAGTMLESLSGEWHEVVTGISLLSVATGQEMVDADITHVKFRKLSNELINQYCSTSEPYDKAGSYGIQGYGSLLVEKIEGDYCNVMGLPVQKVSVMLENMGIQPLSWL